MAERRRVDYDEVVFPLDIEGDEVEIRIRRDRLAATVSLRIDGLPRSCVFANFEDESSLSVRVEIPCTDALDMGGELVQIAR